MSMSAVVTRAGVGQRADAVGAAVSVVSEALAAGVDALDGRASPAVVADAIDRLADNRAQDAGDADPVVAALRDGAGILRERAVSLTTPIPPHPVFLSHHHAEAHRLFLTAALAARLAVGVAEWRRARYGAGDATARHLGAVASARWHRVPSRQDHQRDTHDPDAGLHARGRAITDEIGLMGARRRYGAAAAEIMAALREVVGRSPAMETVPEDGPEQPPVCRLRMG